MWNMLYLITGAIFILLLAAVFFSKEMINTDENRLFKLIIVFNIVGYLIEIPLQLLVRTCDINNILIDVLCRLYLISITINYTLFTIYVFVVCLDNKKENYAKKIEKISNILHMIEVVIVGLLVILPFNKYYDTSKMYIDGQALSLLKCCIMCHICIYFILLLKNFRKLRNKKYLPIYFIIILLLFMTILNSIDPSILITNMIVTFICYTMSFTIENPDMRLLEEIHKSKIISDNANEEKTMFLYNMTQEIRNTTDEINNNANEILDSDSLDDNKDLARNIIAITSKFASMTNEILDVSQIDSDSIKTYNSKYNIKNILKQIINVYNEECRKKDLKFITNVDHDIPNTLYGDSISLKESLNKIFKNSINNTDNGYIEFDVNVIIKGDICRLIFTVEDSSNGMKGEEINSVKSENELLNEVNTLVGVMNGALIISSDYGVGTKVKIVLDQKIEKEDNEDIIKYVKTMNDITILMCDDSDAGIKIVEKLLRGTNIKIDTANNSKEIIDKIKNNKYNLILLDEEIYEVKASELIDKIKSIRNFNTNIVLLTKDNSHEYNEEYLELGFVNYILKPLKKNKLLDCINKYGKK